ncbi:MAG TPA: GDP-mannose 4,6-dehydratase [Ktedonobacterales bacterium]|jgi:GDP-4-dehydro-6-deoxy-D-mannose reductase
MSQEDQLRILITGASGFVGRHLIKRLRAEYPSAAIFGFSHVAHPSDGVVAHPQLTILTGDIRSFADVRAAIVGAHPDWIFHLAGQASVAASWNDPATTLAINAGGAINLLEAVRAEELSPRIVLVGSGEQYGVVPAEDNPIKETYPPAPVNPYAVAKQAQDLFGYQYWVSYRLPTIRVRAFNHFGSFQDDAFVVASLAQQIAEIEAGRHPPTLFVGNLEARRDFLPVGDVVRAYIALAEHGTPGNVYNVGSGAARPVSELLDILLSFAICPIEVQRDPARFRPVDIPLIEADISRIRAETGWEPQIPFDLALRETLDYWRAKTAHVAAQSKHT